MHILRNYFPVCCYAYCIVIKLTTQPYTVKPHYNEIEGVVQSARYKH